MARLVLCALALLAAGGLADPVRKIPQKIADPEFLQKQQDLLLLFYHIHEPTFVPDQKTVASSWDIEKNIEHYGNLTAVKLYTQLLDDGYALPRAVPFSILDPVHRFEAVTLYNLLFSAKDYSTFYKTAAYLRGRVNEGLFVYVLTTVILHRPDTQGVVVPPIYEIFPSFFHNGEIMTTAQRVNIHGKHTVDHYPTTYVRDDAVVIRWNDTHWPYFSEDISLSYLLNDHEWNTMYYNEHLSYPFWLGDETVPLVKDKRGERLWFLHQQILARYYMARLSNGLGEIPELGLDVVQEGITPGLLYHNGIPFPSRPSHYHLDQPHLVDVITEILDAEHRIRDSVESGFVLDTTGELIHINTPEGIDVLGRLIESNVDSPNRKYYKDFITLWKTVLGNSHVHKQVVYHNNHVPLVTPSVLEHYQTALRDPAFYMIWKRVLKLFTLWQNQFPHYKPEELALPTVHIQKVEVDKLQTYFEYAYVNVTNHLHLTTQQREHTYVTEVPVLVQHPQLNHKPFQVRVHVKSDAAKTVLVKFFLAPKYDSKGYEIPLHENTENVILLDEFIHELPAGEVVIKRDPTENEYYIPRWLSTQEIYEKAEAAHQGKGQFILDQTHRFTGMPHRFLLPKGRVGGMPFVFVVYISEYRPPKVTFGTGYDPAVSEGIGSGAQLADEPYIFPFNRPLYQWQVQHLRNFHVRDVTIFHKPTPDIDVPNTE